MTTSRLRLIRVNSRRSDMVERYAGKCAGAVKVIDVREPWEWTVSTPWGDLGFACTPENIPLSRFVNLVGELLAMDERKGTQVALVCRSGSRSLYAARAMRRLGFENVWSLEGGIAFGLR